MDATLEFQDFGFVEQPDSVRVNFLKIFYFTIKKADLEHISQFKISKNSITFRDISERSAENKFNLLISRGFNDLKNSLNGHRTIYIHSDSGIPLIGTRSFGIIDRGSYMLELKPITSCNINCIYCSVDEGASTKKVTDYVIEKDYLIRETRRLIAFKHETNKTKIDIYINPQGEPLLYADIVELVQDLRQTDGINNIHIITNGALLSKELIDDLSKAGLTHLNMSVCSLDEKNAKILAGTAKYDINHIREMMIYAKDKIKVIITPVYIPAKNEDDLSDLVAFAEEHDMKLMIQNFLTNKKGRNPVEQKSWKEFFDFLDSLEKKHDTILRYDGELKMIKTPELDCPFRRNETVKVKMVAPGRYQNESLAVAKERSIVLFDNQFDKPKTAKIRIITVKNNLITAKPL